MHLVKASVSSSRVLGLRQESPDRLEVFSIFSFFTDSSSFFFTTSSFLAGSSFLLTKSSCLRMIDRFLASTTEEGGSGEAESLSRGEARPVVCKNWKLRSLWWRWDNGWIKCRAVVTNLKWSWCNWRGSRSSLRLRTGRRACDRAGQRAGDRLGEEVVQALLDVLAVHLCSVGLTIVIIEEFSP